MSEPFRSRSSGEWLLQLRSRYLEVAQRRVHPDAAEDVVQEALRIVSEKGVPTAGGEAIEGRPPLAWCMQVLRNVIGNHYQKRRTLRRRHRHEDFPPEPADPNPGPVEALETADALGRIEAALEELGRAQDRCVRYLRSLAEGISPRRLAAEERLEEAVLYRRVYRCRQRFRTLLRARGLNL